VIGSRAWDTGALDLAPLATVLAAARSGHLSAGLDVADLRQRRRRAPERRLVLVVVDCSGSMGARDRMAVTKAAILGLLGDAYRHRDLVALMSFRDRGSSLLVGPTRAVAQAVASLHDLPTGGRTPLGQALRDAAAVVRREDARLQVTGTCVVLVTDGRGEAQDLDAGADALTGCGPDIVVVDTETGFVQLGRARRLADRLAARYIRLAA
jgi:magnesium chelatase subunit D